MGSKASRKHIPAEVVRNILTTQKEYRSCKKVHELYHKWICGVLCWYQFVTYWYIRECVDDLMSCLRKDRNAIYAFTQLSPQCVFSLCLVANRVHSVPGVSPSKEEEEVSPLERSELEAISKAIGEYTQLAERFMSFLPQEFTGYVTVRNILDNYIDWSCEAYSDYYQKAADYQEALRIVQKAIDDYLSAFRIVSIGGSTARADIVLEGLHQDAVKAIDSCLLELGQMRLFPYKKGHVNLDQVPQRAGSMFHVPVLVQKRTQLPLFLSKRPLPFLGRWEPNEIKQVQKPPGLYLLCNFCRHVVRCTSQAWSEHQLEKTERPIHRQIWPEMHCFIRRHQNVCLLEDELDQGGYISSAATSLLPLLSVGHMSGRTCGSTFITTTPARSGMV